MSNSHGELPQRSRRWGRERPSENRANERKLHHRLRQELDDLGVQPPLDVQELCRALGRRRGRPLFVRAAQLEKPGPSGLWVHLADMDVILYQQETTELHQQHIILHEVGHILMAEDQDSDEEMPAEEEDYVEGWATLIPAVDPSLVRRVAKRCNYDDEEECSVELVATILMELVQHGGDAPAADPAVRRIEAALGGRRRWV